MNLPIVDLRGKNVPQQLRAACESAGFFYVTGHRIDPKLENTVEDAARKFFALPLEKKMEIEMEKGGAAWRGYFPVGGELTSGRPDQKEGIYFGAELPAGDPRPLHGPNLWPSSVPELRPAVLEYIDALTRLGRELTAGISESLGLPADYFDHKYTRDPVILFRIFNYPPADAESWGVGEHTDYGLLTLLKQDQNAGLEVKSRKGWIAAPPIPGTMVCNIGDMLDRMTGGRYLSTPHRVRSSTGRPRLSFPFFFDPGWDAEIEPLPAVETLDRTERWDGADLHAFRGKYGDYLLRKISKVFPALFSKAQLPPS